MMIRTRAKSKNGMYIHNRLTMLRGKAVGVLPSINKTGMAWADQTKRRKQENFAKKIIDDIQKVSSGEKKRRQVLKMPCTGR